MCSRNILPRSLCSANLIIKSIGYYFLPLYHVIFFIF